MRPLVQTPAKQNENKQNENFTDAVQPFMEDLKGYCRSLAKTRWDGEDLAQETLMKAYKSWLKSPKPISKAYLFRVASNTWIDEYRKRKPDEDFRPDLSDLEDEKTDTEIFEAMEVLLQELSPKQRVAMLLVDGFAYTAGEAGNLVGDSEGSVKAALHRARNKLKRAGGRNFYPEEDEVLTYVRAFHSGEPEKIVRLYQKETHNPQMSISEKGTGFGFSSVQGIGSSYVICSVRMGNGETWFVPFYQMELTVLLSWLAEVAEVAA